MKKITLLFCLFSCFFGITVNGQQDKPQGPSLIAEAVLTKVASPLASRTSFAPFIGLIGEANDGRKVRGAKSEVVPGKGSDIDDPLATTRHRREQILPSREPSLVFDTATLSFNGRPTDPSIAVGPNHAFVVFNSGFRIFDKVGNSLLGPLNASEIFSTGGCCDLTVSYDNVADRWVLTYLFSSNDTIQVAVSEGSDPTTTEWNVYTVADVDDYNKLSVWSDGYYVTGNTNQTGVIGGATAVYALDREAMLRGDATAEVIGFPLPGIAKISNNSFYAPQFLNVSSADAPAAGGATVVFHQDDSFSGVDEDHIKVWTIDADFDTPANSTISDPLELVTATFNSVFDGGGFANFAQPNGGSLIDGLHSIIGNQAQFRKFATHNSAVFSFVVDVDAGADKLGGVRWIELRQTADNEPWMLFQEGTYTSPDGKHAWNASIIMDVQGNMGMGYTGMSGTTDTFASSYYTGRFANDPPGVMTVEETLIKEGKNNFPGDRYGDYSKIDVDPIDNRKFYFINEITEDSNNALNTVGVFQIAAILPNDVGVVSVDTPIDGILSTTEQVSVTVFNFGENDASGFDVTYSIDGGAVVSEAFTGTIPSGEFDTFTFGTTADLSTVGATYAITASSDSAIDEDNSNDAVTVNVTNLEPNDVGVTAITAPTSGSGLTATEMVTVTIENFGGATQTSIPVFYTLNGGAPVSETYTGSIPTGETDTYTFTATADLSELTDYDFVAGTELTGDADTSNDDTTQTVTNSLCMPGGNCELDNDGVIVLTLADQDITPDCGTTIAGYTDQTDIVFNFVLDDNPFEGVLQTGFNDSEYAIFIDFNDNNAFEEDELVSNEAVPTGNTDFEFTINFADIPTTTTGMHRMRVRGEDEDQDGDVLNPCETLAFGRTNDFTANISGALGLNENDFAGTDLQINYLADDQYEVVFNNTTSFDKRLPITVFNTLGQKLAYYTVDNTGAGYRKTIDMSYVAAGIYFIKVGDETLNKVKKIVVQ